MKVLYAAMVVILFAIIMFPPEVQRGSMTRKQASPPFHPNAIARSLTAAPGAIVCSDLESVKLVFDLYADHWQDTLQDAMTNGQASTIRGPAAPAPNPQLYGCSVLRPGTPVYVENADAFSAGIPSVTAKLPDGTFVRGVTLPSMLSSPSQPAR